MHLHHAPCTLGLAVIAACSPGNPVMEDTGHATDWIFDCTGDNDGTIDADELPWATGLAVPYLANGAGTTVDVQPAGETVADGTIWDFTQPPGTLAVELDLVDPSAQWFAEHFPDASYAAPLFAQELDILAVFAVYEDGFEMQGLASREAQPADGQTLLVYDEPVEVYRFPLELGTAWEASSSFRDASLYGVPNAGEELYRFEVDSVGSLLLPGFTMEKTLRLRVEVEQTFAVSTGDNPVVSMRYLYLHECYGELARITSLAGETEPEFGEASEVRVLDVEG